MPSGQPVPVTAMTPYDDKPIPVVAMRVTRAMAAPSLCRRPSSSSDEYTLTLSEHTLFPTPVDARPAFVPFQLSDEQCAYPPSLPPCFASSSSRERCLALTDANIYRHPNVYGYPTLPINSVRGPKFGPCHWPARICLPAGRIQLLLLLLRRIHLHRDARGERASSEASRAP